METISFAATKFQAENCGTFEALPSWRARGRSSARTRRITGRAGSRRALPRARVTLLRRGRGIWPRHRQYFNWLNAEAVAETVFQFETRQRSGWAFMCWKKCPLMFADLLRTICICFMIFEHRAVKERGARQKAVECCVASLAPLFGSVLICLLARVFLWKQN